MQLAGRQVQLSIQLAFFSYRPDRHVQRTTQGFPLQGGHSIQCGGQIEFEERHLQGIAEKPVSTNR